MPKKGYSHPKRRVPYPLINKATISPFPERHSPSQMQNILTCLSNPMKSHISTNRVVQIPDGGVGTLCNVHQPTLEDFPYTSSNAVSVQEMRVCTLCHVHPSMSGQSRMLTIFQAGVEIQQQCRRVEERERERIEVKKRPKKSLVPEKKRESRLYSPRCDVQSKRSRKGVYSSRKCYTTKKVRSLSV
jgi:hypothetical protein